MVSLGDVYLYEEDIALLDGSEWLNDQLIAFWFEHLLRSVPEATRERVALLPPSTALLLASLGERDAAPIFGQLGLSEKALILAPVSDGRDVARAGSGSHWSLVVYRRWVPNGRGLSATVVGAGVHALPWTRSAREAPEVDDFETGVRGAETDAAEAGGLESGACEVEVEVEISHWDSACGANSRAAGPYIRVLAEVGRLAGCRRPTMRVLPRDRPATQPGTTLSPRAPQQRDSSSCGLFVAAFSEVLVEALSEDASIGWPRVEGAVREAVTRDRVGRMRADMRAAIERARGEGESSTGGGAGA